MGRVGGGGVERRGYSGSQLAGVSLLSSPVISPVKDAE